MTDCELLELAAKAAGDKLDWFYPPVGSPVAYVNEFVWNPLADDGDALRLAVKLSMRIEMNAEYVTVIHDLPYSPLPYSPQEQYSDSDPYAATRRAIVGAAAEIGRNMK